jgi:hypothetical protein
MHGIVAALVYRGDDDVPNLGHALDTLADDIEREVEALDAKS